MSSYIITFETASASTRERIVERIKKYSYMCPIHKDCWAIVTEEKAVQIRDGLAPLLGPADRLFVVRSGTEAAWVNLYSEKHLDWLKRYL